ncbi:GNAT family N-acetyltransferase [Butyrivibrio sp. VCD2006]|uniref:GNAT family N-acetyltransferase n=1 Tax=Butyrivibrio sp. VCD2006 TaxID=1280664 RepID=UPI00040462BE|nr:GNAT family N-acetyltransferase [Butyrivibrio sp. VCD2006]
MELIELNPVQVESIYKERLIVDFPEDELKPLDVILRAMEKGIYECLGLWDEGAVIGYAFLVKMDIDYLIDYLAIYPEKRNSGIGGKMLELLSEYFAEADNILIEIEDPDKAVNEEEKQLQTRRRSFYLRNICQDTGLRIKCFGVPFQLLVLGKIKSENVEALRELYISFYRMVLPKQIFDENIWEFDE